MMIYVPWNIQPKCFPKGKDVALVGQIGSGQNTIANLMTRFLWCKMKVKLKLDGLDIRDFKQKHRFGG